jgi:hypothetical protein
MASRINGGRRLAACLAVGASLIGGLALQPAAAQPYRRDDHRDAHYDRHRDWGHPGYYGGPAVVVGSPPAYYAAPPVVYAPPPPPAGLNLMFNIR